MPEADIIENRREILLAPPGMRLWRGVSAIARTVFGKPKIALRLTGPGWASMTYSIMLFFYSQQTDCLVAPNQAPEQSSARAAFPFADLPIFLLPI